MSSFLKKTAKNPFANLSGINRGTSLQWDLLGSRYHKILGGENISPGKKGMLWALMDDREIIDLYFQRDERAIWESQRRYGTYCSTIARNITVDSRDAEECVNETWLRAWNGIPPQRPLFLKAFLGKITRNLALDSFRKEKADSRGGGRLPLVLEELSECIPSGDTIEGQVDARELGRAISGFIRGLKQRDGDLFLRRYFYMDSLEESASHVGMSAKHAAVSLYRTRKKLEDY